MFVGIGVGVGRQRFAPNYISKLVNNYVKRVTLDGGIVESIDCFTNFAISYGASSVPKKFYNTKWSLITQNWQDITTNWNN